jgi:hypothetical protein
MKKTTAYKIPLGSIGCLEIPVLIEMAAITATDVPVLSATIASLSGYRLRMAVATSKSSHWLMIHLSNQSSVMIKRFSSLFMDWRKHDLDACSFWFPKQQPNVVVRHFETSSQRPRFYIVWHMVGYTPALPLVCHLGGRHYVHWS